METIDWSIMDDHANLSVLPAAKNHVTKRSQVPRSGEPITLLFLSYLLSNAAALCDKLIH
jgi:hypothetical protein